MSPPRPSGLALARTAGQRYDAGPMAANQSKGRVVAIVGATGAVGEVLLSVLEERAFPVAELRPLASERSTGTTITFRGKQQPVELVRPEAFDGADFVFFAATG